PIILTKAAGRDPLAVPALVKLAEALGAPVIDQFHTYMNFPQDHPLHAGFDAAPYLDDADCIVAVESDVLWYPALKAPRPEAKIIQIAMDPLYARYPIRGFPADSALSGTVRLNLAALADAGRRPRVGPGRGPRRQAGRARQDGHLLRRRRCLHLRRAHRGALRLARLQPAGAVRDLQQPRVERGEARRDEPRARGPRREDRP